MEQSASAAFTYVVQQHPPSSISTRSSSNRRKRAPTDEQDLNPKLIAKRAKAAERQRRKRERDRRASFLREQTFTSGSAHAQVPLSFHQPPNATSAPAVDTPQPLVAGGPPVPAGSPTPAPMRQDVQTQTQTPQPVPAPLAEDEEARKERVRAAARERQRKHRALVKRKKLMELGVQMGDGGLMPEELTYTLGPDGNYTPSHAPPQTGESELPGPSHEIAGAENGFLPNGVGLSGGQTFAGYVLLALSCFPQLRQNLLRQVHMTNEDLQSLEPVLCAAFEQWDHHVRPTIILHVFPTLIY